MSSSKLSDFLELTLEQESSLRDWNSRKEYTSAKLAENGIPVYMRDGLMKYVLLGTETGGFLTTLICNAPWVRVMTAADETNQALIRNYLLFFYNAVPRECWGSESTMRMWVKDGGLAGKYELDPKLVRLAITTGRVSWP